jgi:hypothetical protein
VLDKGGDNRKNRWYKRCVPLLPWTKSGVELGYNGRRKKRKKAEDRAHVLSAQRTRHSLVGTRLFCDQLYVGMFYTLCYSRRAWLSNPSPFLNVSESPVLREPFRVRIVHLRSQLARVDEFEAYDGEGLSIGKCNAKARVGAI